MAAIRPKEATYACTIGVQVVLSARSMVVHDAGAVGMAVRQYLQTALPAVFTRAGLKFAVSTIEVDTIESKPAMPVEKVI